MSLVGPRPDLPEALDFYDAGSWRRLLVKPGITGLAQVSGRNALTPEEKWHLDVEYATSATLATDLRILAKTLVRRMRRTDVYTP